MMGHKEKLSARECDGLPPRCHRLFRWRAADRAQIKRGLSKRNRKTAKLATKAAYDA